MDFGKKVAPRRRCLSLLDSISYKDMLVNKSPPPPSSSYKLEPSPSKDYFHFFSLAARKADFPLQRADFPIFGELSDLGFLSVNQSEWKYRPVFDFPATISYENDDFPRLSTMTDDCKQSDEYRYEYICSLSASNNGSDNSMIC